MIMNKKGFTLVEILVVVSIIAVLSTVGSVFYLGQTAKARDSIRKQHLNSLSLALGIYSQENGQYIPPQPGDENCTRDTNAFYSQIAPFMSETQVPKDPQNNNQYCYISVNNGQGFRLFAKLENCQDPQNPLCSYETYNYSVVSEDLTVAAVSGDIQSRPSPCPPIGDVRGDGMVSDADATDVLRMRTYSTFSDGTPVTEEHKRRGDVTTSDGLTSADALIIQRYVRGMISTFPACSS